MPASFRTRAAGTNYGDRMAKRVGAVTKLGLALPWTLVRRWAIDDVAASWVNLGTPAEPRGANCWQGTNGHNLFVRYGPRPSARPLTRLLPTGVGARLGRPIQLVIDGIATEGRDLDGEIALVEDPRPPLNFLPVRIGR